LASVIFTGWVDERKLAVLMRRADIGLAAYRDNAPQGLPNKLGEYAAGGLAILSSLSGETARLIAEYQCGFTYEGDNPREIVARLQQWATAPCRLKDARRNSRRLFREQFDGNAIYNTIAEYLIEIANVDSIPRPTHST